MPQPTPYNRGFSFTDFQAGHPSNPIPGPHVDAELDGIVHTLSGVLGNLSLIQRDDGKLADGCVTIDAISSSLFVAIVEAAGGGEYLAPNLTFTSHTLGPGAAATVAVSGVYPDLTVDIGVPKGDAAAPGAATLEDGVYGDVTITGGGTVFEVTKVNGQTPSFPGHTHTQAEVVGLVAALAEKADAAAVTAALATKADAFTNTYTFDQDFGINDGHNGQYIRMVGATTRTITFGTPTAGHAMILVNRGSVNMTVACAGGYYKNGAAASATTNLTLAPGAKLTAFHEGAGVWTFDGTGF